MSIAIAWARSVLLYVTFFWVSVATAYTQSTPTPPNLILDGSFEVGRLVPPPPSCDQGALPDTWTQLTSAFQPADTYTSASCVVYGGMPLGTFSHFVQTLSPANGQRFCAGCWCFGVVETFGTTLLSSMTPGDVYSLSGYFSASLVHPGNCGYYVRLQDPTSQEWVTVGTIGDHNVENEWIFNRLAFVAPVAARAISLEPRTNALGEWSYVAVDALVLTPAAAFMPGIYALGGESPASQGGPVLEASNAPQVGSVVHLQINRGSPLQAGLVIMGLSAINQPLLGGILVPSLDVLWPVVIGPNGRSSTVQVPWLGGRSLYTQCWALDPTHSFGIAASPALLLL